MKLPTSHGHRGTKDCEYKWKMGIGIESNPIHFVFTRLGFCDGSHDGTSRLSDSEISLELDTLEFDAVHDISVMIFSGSLWIRM
jgi:hypothetical protein